ncbi:hypothetical protein Tco_0474987 [Tanacetum coccineum]
MGAKDCCLMGLREEMGGASLNGDTREGVQARFAGVEVYEVGLMVWLLLLAAVAYLGKRRAMWPSLLTKRRSKLLETPKVLLLAWDKFFEIQHAQPEDIQELLHKLLKDLQIIREELAEYINCPSWNRPALYDDDDDDDEYTIQYREYLENSSKAITPNLPTEEPDNSLSMGDEHLDTIPETKSDEVIKSSVKDLVPIPCESEGIFDIMCDVPFCDKNHFDAESDLMESLLNRDTLIVYSPKIDSLLEEFVGELAPINPILMGINKADFVPKEDSRLIEQLLYDNSPPLDALKDHFEIFFNFNDDSTSSDDDSFEDIDYVEASPPDSELVSLEEVKDDLLREKLLNINLLIAKIESLNNNSIFDCVFKSPIPVKDSDSFFENSNTSLSYSDKSLPEFETFSDHTEETSSSSTTTHADNSLPKYDSFLF